MCYVSLRMTGKKPDPHPAEMAEDLPRPLPGRKWPAVKGALQFAELIEEDSAWLL